MLRSGPKPRFRSPSGGEASLIRRKGGRSLDRAICANNTFKFWLVKTKGTLTVLSIRNGDVIGPECYRGAFQGGKKRCSLERDLSSCLSWLMTGYLLSYFCGVRAVSLEQRRGGASAVLET